jgi:uncharacterized cupredoxin-like copper-binding protein
MSRSILLSTLVLSLAVLAGPVSAGPGAAGHGHGNSGFSAGEPGDPKKPARVIQVTFRETDGKRAGLAGKKGTVVDGNTGDPGYKTMIFIPDRVEVRKGEQIRFVLRNNGEIDHEFVLATTAENLKHAEQMQKNPEMEHDDPNSKRLAPKKVDGLVWRFTKSGEFEFACLIPGHRESGMIGKIVVK